MTNDKKESTQVSRRQFMGTVPPPRPAITIVPRHVLGGAGFQAPSDTVNIGVVGYVHGMGTSNLINMAKSDNIVALCDCDESAAAKEALERRGTLKNNPKAVQYKDFRVMLEKQKNIDAVLVATPDHTHAVIAMAAMQLGKHVYVQKPLTRTISEARALTEAARKYKVVTQMGNQGHSEEGLRLMQEWLDAGAIGQVREVHCWTNRPIWPQGMPRPAETPGGARRPRLGTVARPRADAPVPQDVPSVRLARVAGLRRRRDGRHGLSRHGRGVDDPEARRADQHHRVAGLQLPAPGARTARVRPARRVQRQLSAVLDHPPVVPGARQHGAGEPALVRRRPAPRAARGSRAGAEAAGVGHDLRRRQGQDVVRDLLREPAPHPGDGHAGLPAPAEDSASRARRTSRAREELARCDQDQGPGGLALRLRRAVHRIGAARQRGLALPRPAAALGLCEHEGHQHSGGRPVHPDTTTARAGR